MTDIESFIFNIENSNKAPNQGSLLIAEPFLREDYFCHAVICITDYENGKSAMGIVMNKPTRYTLCELVPDIYPDFNLPIYCGGPLSCDRLYYIHTLGNTIRDAKEISNGLFIGGNFDDIITYINEGNNTKGIVRFFLGYSGWDPCQLENELKHNVWAVASNHNNHELLVGENDNYWHRYVKSMGDEYRGWQYHPENPQYN